MAEASSNDARVLANPGPDGPGFFLLLRMWWGDRPWLQIAAVLGVAVLLWILGVNAVATMHRLGLSPGFGFLGWSANFAISDTLIEYAPGDTYGRALLVGLINTVSVSVLGCVLATVLGVALAIARLSGNLLLAGLVRGYVEIMRNTPLLLQLFFWSAVTHAFPAPRQALHFLGAAYLSNRGVFVPGISVTGLPPLFWAACIGIAFAIAIRYAMQRGQRRIWKHLLAPAGLLLVGAAVAGAAVGGHAAVALPELKGFNIQGGLALSPEFAALLTGLVINSAASISEVVRAGIQSVPLGQREAGHALGLSRGRIMRLIVLPQAFRVITPLMTSSYLDLAKNSSLAVAIGFPDLVSVANTSANQTGQAFEMIAILVAVYLALNLSVSYALNRYNAKLLARDNRAGARPA